MLRRSATERIIRNTEKNKEIKEIEKEREKENEKTSLGRTHGRRKAGGSRRCSNNVRRRRGKSEGEKNSGYEAKV